MQNFLSSLGLRPVDGINALILLIVIWMFVRIVLSEATQIIYADYISSRGTDGRQHGDLDKVGQVVGIIVAALVVLMYADNEKVEPLGLAALLGVSLLYLGGVTMYAKYIRSKQGSIQTVTEPADTTPTKVTVTETPPIATK